MPTVLRQQGYRFFFYSLEGKSKPHIRVFRAGAEAKIWLSPIDLAKNSGFPSYELQSIFKIVESHESMLLDKWYEYFGY